MRVTIFYRVDLHIYVWNCKFFPPSNLYFHLPSLSPERNVFAYSLSLNLFFLHYPCAEANSSQTSYSKSPSNMVNEISCRRSFQSPSWTWLDHFNSASTRPQPLQVQSVRLPRHGVGSLTAVKRLESFPKCDFSGWPALRISRVRTPGHRATLTTNEGNKQIEKIKRDGKGRRKDVVCLCVQLSEHTIFPTFLSPWSRWLLVGHPPGCVWKHKLPQCSVAVNYSLPHWTLSFHLTGTSGTWVQNLFNRWVEKRYSLWYSWL